MTSTRKRGFQQPFSGEQILVWFAHPFSTLVYFFWISSVLPFKQFSVCYILVAISVIVVLILWFYVEVSDPSSEHESEFCSFVWRAHGRRWRNSRYCSKCKKAVEGLDHHCSWLNTCVGKRNYRHFFVMSVAATLQFGLQVVFGILGLVVWASSQGQGGNLRRRAVQGFFGGSIVAFEAVGWFQVGLSVLGFFGTSSLLGFHIYLHFLGVTTYDWVLGEHIQERNNAKEAKEKRREEQNKQLTLASGTKKPDVERPVEPKVQLVSAENVQCEHALKSSSSIQSSSKGAPAKPRTFTNNRVMPENVEIEEADDAETPEPKVDTPLTGSNS